MSNVPPRPKSLLVGRAAGGKFFTRSRPQYENFGTGEFMSALDNRVMNDNTGDQASAINAFLAAANAANKIAYFPAGIYLVGDTVRIPVGSRVQGSSWSQVRRPRSQVAVCGVVWEVGVGSTMADLTPVDRSWVSGPTSVMRRIPALLFRWARRATLAGWSSLRCSGLSRVRPRAPSSWSGMSMKDWFRDKVCCCWCVWFNPERSIREAQLIFLPILDAYSCLAAMWDCHFRIGGADGTGLGLADCPAGNKDYDKCTAAALLFHVTSKASGYFENVWVWTADQ